MRGFFRIGGENEYAIPMGRSKASLGRGSHPAPHAVGYALRNIKSEDPLFLLGLTGNPLRVGETKNQEQKNNGSCQDDDQPLITDAHPEERQTEQQPEKQRLGKLNIREKFFHGAQRLISAGTGSQRAWIDEPLDQQKKQRSQ